jgi:LPXTG-motif cell wall-anchored protein
MDNRWRIFIGGAFVACALVLPGRTVASADDGFVPVAAVGTPVAGSVAGEPGTAAAHGRARALPTQRIVTPGSFCSESEAGQTGVTSAGTVMVCAATLQDPAYRWRAVDDPDLAPIPPTTAPAATVPPATTPPTTTTPPTVPPPADPQAPPPGEVGAPTELPRTGDQTTSLAILGTAILLAGMIFIAGSESVSVIGRTRRGGFTLVLVDDSGRSHRRRVVASEER